MPHLLEDMKRESLTVGLYWICPSLSVLTPVKPWLRRLSTRWVVFQMYCINFNCMSYVLVSYVLGLQLHQQALACAAQEKFYDI